jgi:hypothetical protein
MPGRYLGGIEQHGWPLREIAGTNICSYISAADLVSWPRVVVMCGERGRRH